MERLPDWLTAEQKADIAESLRRTQLRKEQAYYARMDREQYGSPEITAPVESPYRPPKHQEFWAVMNKLENDINGLKKIGHTHSKKDKSNVY